MHTADYTGTLDPMELRAGPPGATHRIEWERGITTWLRCRHDHHGATDCYHWGGCSGWILVVGVGSASPAEIGQILADKWGQRLMGPPLGASELVEGRLAEAPWVGVGHLVQAWDTGGWTTVGGPYATRGVAEAAIAGLRSHTVSILDAGETDETDETEYRVVGMLTD